jgi:hypothetical protein
MGGRIGRILRDGVCEYKPNPLRYQMPPAWIAFIRCYATTTAAAAQLPVKPLHHLLLPLPLPQLPSSSSPSSNRQMNQYMPHLETSEGKIIYMSVTTTREEWTFRNIGGG